MSKREYVQANREWLEAKSKEEGVKALSRGIYYKVLKEGNQSSEQPNIRSIITAHYTGKTINGKKFDSKHEADVYDDLLLEMRAGIFAAVACQVDFVLPGGVRYRADFVAMRPGGNEYRVIDAKSEATRKDKTYRLKRRQMRECLGIEIEER